jgi:hypothetical protein
MLGAICYSSLAFVVLFTTVGAEASVTVTYADFEDRTCSTGAKVTYANLYTRFLSTSQRCVKLNTGAHILVSEECLNGLVVATTKTCAAASCSYCSDSNLESYTYTSTDYDRFLAGQGQCYSYTVTRRGISGEQHFQETATHSGFSGAVQNVCRTAAASGTAVTVNYAGFEDSKCSTGAKVTYANVYTHFLTTSQRCVRLPTGAHILLSDECLNGLVVTTTKTCSTASCGGCGGTNLESYIYTSSDYDKFLAGQGQCYSYTVTRRNAGFSDEQHLQETATHSGFSGAVQNVCRTAAASGSVQRTTEPPRASTEPLHTAAESTVSSGSKQHKLWLARAFVPVVVLAATFRIIAQTD